MTAARQLLLIGEQAVGKTHYGAQALKRLLTTDGTLQMRGAASDIEPYEEAMVRLSMGLAATHTPTNRYVESRWPVVTDIGLEAELIWPDYGGEQVLEITRRRCLEPKWVERATASDSWIFMIRSSQTHQADDIFSRPLGGLTPQDADAPGPLSDQARLVELLQFLLYCRSAKRDQPLTRPRLTILLSCWDELTNPGRPLEALGRTAPLLRAFVESNWHPDSLNVLGLSALERALDRETPDMDFARRGPENFGYVVRANGEVSRDLLEPLSSALRDLG